METPVRLATAAAGLPRFAAAPAVMAAAGDDTSRRDAAPSTTSSVASQPGSDAFDRGSVRMALPSPPHMLPLQHGIAPRHGDTAATGATEAAPIVHVTIDRIDVRLPPAAAPTPSSRPRASRAAQPAPLADYLRGRPAPGTQGGAR